jgi:hypothetical protein
MPMFQIRKISRRKGNLQVLNRYGREHIKLLPVLPSAGEGGWGRSGKLRKISTFTLYTLVCIHVPLTWIL